MHFVNNVIKFAWITCLDFDSSNAKFNTILFLVHQCISIVDLQKIDIDVFVNAILIVLFLK